MAENRRIRKVVRSRATIEGQAFICIGRSIGDRNNAIRFFLLDDFRSDRPEHYLKGFPWIPIGGMETSLRPARRCRTWR